MAHGTVGSTVAPSDDASAEMTPDQGEHLPPAEVPPDDEWQDEPPRSIVHRTWFRVLLVLVVLGAVAAVSIPYVIDSVSRVPAPPRVATAPPPSPPAPSTAPSVPTPAPIAKPAAPPIASPPSSSKSAVETPRRAKPEASPAPAGRVAAIASETTTERATAEKSAKSVAKASNAAPPGDYWIQVGAYRDRALAARVAAGLRDHGFQVQEFSVTRDGRAGAPAEGAARPTDRYDVMIAGPPEDVVPKLERKGLAVEPTGTGVRVRTSLPLREAVALSKDLASDGFKVHVKRAGPVDATAPPSGGAPERETLHRVRVVALADRDTAVETMHKLEALGYTAFVGHGRE